MSTTLAEILSNAASHCQPVFLDAAVKGLAILMFAAFASLLMRRASAAARHLVWHMAIIGLLVLPMVSAASPGWHVLPDWFNANPRPVESAPAPTVAPADALAVDAPLPVPDAPLEYSAPPTSEPIATPPPSVAPITAGPAVIPAQQSGGPGLAAWVLLVWAIGAIVSILPLFLGMVSLWRLGRRSRHITDGPWHALLASVSAELGLKRPVTLLASEQRSVPMVWGGWPWSRTALLLPESACDWSAQRLRVVLLHELAHVKRRDCLTHILTQFACAVYWFNPLTWLAAWRMRIERERACDDIVVAGGSEPTDYAEQLLQIASSLRGNRIGNMAAIAMARRSNLESRLLAILDEHRNRRTLTRLAVVAAVVLLAAIVVPVAMLRAQAAEDTRREAEDMPAWANAVVYALRDEKWEVVEYDPGLSLKIDGHRISADRLLLRRGRKEWLNESQSQRSAASVERSGRYKMQYTHLDIVTLPGEEDLPADIAGQIPWQDVAQEFFVKPVDMGRKMGRRWFARAPVYWQDHLREKLDLSGGDDRVALLVEGLAVEDKGRMTVNSCVGLLTKVGDRALPQLQAAVGRYEGAYPVFGDLIRAIAGISGKRSTALLKELYASDSDQTRKTAAFGLIHEPFREEAKDEYLDMLHRGLRLREASGACTEFGWKEAIPLLEAICNKPSSWGVFISAYEAKLALENKSLAESLVEAKREVLREVPTSTGMGRTKIERAKRIMVNSPAKEAAAVMAVQLAAWRGWKAPGEKVEVVREIGRDILRHLPDETVAALLRKLVRNLDERGNLMATLKGLLGDYERTETQRPKRRAAVSEETASAPQHVGRWRSVEMTRNLSKELRYVSLDLHPDGSFLLTVDSPKKGGKPYYDGEYQVEGRRLLLAKELEEIGVTGALIDGDTIRLLTGVGTAILKKYSTSTPSGRAARPRTGDEQELIRRARGLIAVVRAGRIGENRIMLLGNDRLVSELTTYGQSHDLTQLKLDTVYAGKNGALITTQPLPDKLGKPSALCIGFILGFKTGWRARSVEVVGVESYGDHVKVALKQSPDLKPIKVDVETARPVTSVPAGLAAYDHFIGTYAEGRRLDRTRAFREPHLGGFTITRKNGTYVAHSTGGPSYEMEIAADGLACTDGGEWFTFTYDASTNRYSVRVHSKSDPQQKTVAVFELIKLTGKNSQPNSAPRGKGFTPTIEQVVNSVDDSPEGCLIDLDSGVVHTPPEELTAPSADAQLKAWAKSNRIDAGARITRNEGQIIDAELVGIDMIVAKVGAEAWESATPELIRSALSTAAKERRGPPSATVSMSGKGPLPATYFFRTGEGSIGVLKIIELVADPPGIKIRCKLVQEEARTNETAGGEAVEGVGKAITPALDSIQTVERFIKLSLAKPWIIDAARGKETEAGKMVYPGRLKEMEDLRSLPGAAALKVDHAYANDVTAKLTTTPIRRQDGSERVVVFKLRKLEGEWLVFDVDAEPIEKGMASIESFRDLPGVRSLTKRRMGKGKIVNRIDRAAKDDDARVTAEAFYQAIAEGNDAAAQLISEEGEFPRGFGRVRETLDLAKGKIDKAWADNKNACAVTTFMPLKGRDGQGAFGLGLRRAGNRWIVRDFDWLPDQQAMDKFIAGFRQVAPTAALVSSPLDALVAGKGKMIFDALDGRLRIYLPGLAANRIEIHDGNVLVFSDGSLVIKKPRVVAGNFVLLGDKGLTINRPNDQRIRVDAHDGKVRMHAKDQTVSSDRIEFSLQNGEIRGIGFGRASITSSTAKTVVESLAVKTGGGDLQQLIDAAEDGETVIVPRGVHTEPVHISKSLTLRGESRTESVFEVTADRPAIFVDSKGKGKVTLEDVTIRWQLATSDRCEYPTAVAVKDTAAEVRNCSFQPLGNYRRSPVAIRAMGFSDLTIDTCRFERFEYTICFNEGTEGTVRNSLVFDSGHQGIMLYSGATVKIVGNVVTGSKYHAVRSTGGTLHVKDNLIINNANRGIYLGNKSAAGTITNNVIIGNATGIGGFARSKVQIANNVIADSAYAGIGMRESCSLLVKDNIFRGNRRGWVMFKDGAKGANTVHKNTFWQNEADAENLDKTPDSIMVEPPFADPANGDFSLKPGPALEQKQGLTDPQPFRPLWRRWANRSDTNEPFTPVAVPKEVTASAPAGRAPADPGYTMADVRITSELGKAVSASAVPSWLRINDKGEIMSGRGLVKKPVGGAVSKVSVDRLHVPSPNLKAMVRVELSPDRARSLLGSALASAASLYGAMLQETNGNQLLPVAYVWDKQGSMEIVVSFDQPFRSSRNLPVRQMKKGDKLYLYYLANRGSRIEQFHIGPSKQAINLDVP